MSDKRPEIFTARSKFGTECSFSPSRGGIITSLKFQGKEILYMDEETFCDPTKNVRGGIPILFPNAGPIEHPDFPGLKQHGFARDMVWQAKTGNETGFFETLVSDESTRRVFPFDFLLSMRGYFWTDGALTIFHEVQNKEETIKMPISMGLHPYLYVPADQKSNVVFDFPGGEIVSKERDKWLNGTAVSIKNPSTARRVVPLRIYFLDFGRVIIMTVSSQYQRIWVWSLPSKDFICIEPVMRDVGGLANDPKLVKSGKVFNASMTIKAFCS